jgi:hypothetical protein
MARITTDGNTKPNAASVQETMNKAFSIAGLPLNLMGPGLIQEFTQEKCMLILT